ncbi:MAG: DUF167 domain-containing protein [Dehalococcoidales bacterium]|nr:DUF167 domain-containing protein [Dehalococcoidales bacterium]
MGIKNYNPDIRLALRVTPNAGRNEITGYKDRVLQVRVAAAPEKGKANKLLIDLLATTLGIRKSAITIIKGESSRNKVVLIKGISSEKLSKILKQG